MELVEELVLGNDEKAAEEYLLAGPAHIKVDSQRRIYVADAYRGAISVFDHEGTFVTRIGGRGQGPGEISEVTAMAVDPNDDLLVLDRLNGRLTRFSELGRQIEMYPNPEPFRISAYWMWSLEAGNLALNYRIPTPNPDEDPDPELIHRYDARFTAREESLVPAHDIWDLTRPFERAISSSPRAILFIPQAEGLLVVPQLYAGIIYRYTKKAGGWEMQQWQGKIPPYRPYKLLDAEAVRNNEKLGRVAYRKSGPEGRFAALTRSSSRGLFALTDGRVVHFTVMERGETKHLGVELFEKDGQFLGYGAVVNIAASSIYEPFIFKVHDTDAEDRFYVSRMSRSGAAVLSVYRLEIEAAAE